MEINIKKIEISKSGKSLNIYSTNNRRRFYVSIKKLSSEFLKSALNSVWTKASLSIEELETAPGWFKVEQLFYFQNDNDITLLNISNEHSVKTKKASANTASKNHKYINPLEWGFDPNDSIESESAVQSIKQNVEIKKATVVAKKKSKKPVRVILLKIDRNIARKKIVDLISDYAQENDIRMGKTKNKIAIVDPNTKHLITINTFIKRYVKKI